MGEHNHPPGTDHPEGVNGCTACAREVAQEEWARLYRLNQVDLPDYGISAAVILAEVRRIVNGDDAPYGDLPPFSRLVDLVAWLDRHGYIHGPGDCV